VAVERVFSQHNVRTVMGTAQAGAVAIVCAARRGIPVALHTPSEVKAAVTGSGRADKAQVTAMVTRLLRLADAPRPADAADALALAICHIWRGGAQARLAAAQAQAALAATTPAGLGRITPGAAAPDQAALQQAALQQAALQQAALQQARRNGAALRRAALEQAMTRQTGWRQAGGPR
jgi:crossover junction endodeoxyribonuclease RuvC